MQTDLIGSKVVFSDSTEPKDKREITRAKGATPGYVEGDAFTIHGVTYHDALAQVAAVVTHDRTRELIVFPIAILKVI